MILEEETRLRLLLWRWQQLLIRVRCGSQLQRNFSQATILPKFTMQVYSKLMDSYSDVICYQLASSVPQLQFHCQPLAHLLLPALISSSCCRCAQSLQIYPSSLLDSVMAWLSTTAPAGDCRGLDLSCCRHASNITSPLSLIDLLNPDGQHIFLSTAKCNILGAVLFLMQ